LRTTDDARALELIRDHRGVENAVIGEHGLGFQAQESDVGELSLALGAAGVGILALSPELATLEDLFFRLTEGNGTGSAGVAEDGPSPTAGTLVGAPVGSTLHTAQQTPEIAHE
jgi:hypothetical protein